jgi:glutamate receptor, ionotropic, invertebrate
MFYRNCNFSIVGEVFAEQPYAVAVQQGSLLAEDLSKAILTMQKERFFDDLKAKYWNNSASCREDDDSEGITLESLGGIFIASIVGLGN